MKKSELRLMIRKIVREEVALSIKEVISEIVKPTKTISKSKPKPQQKHYSSNSVLNDVLNETAQGGDWKTLGGEKITTERMSEIVGGNYAEMMNDTSNTPQPQVPSSDPMSQFVNKDYSNVLKKAESIDKRKNGG